MELGVGDVRIGLRHTWRVEQARRLNEIPDSDRHRPFVRLPSVYPMTGATNDPTTSSANASVPPPDRVMRQRLLCAAFRYPLSSCRGLVR
jgi:hypothetical protein